MLEQKDLKQPNRLGLSGCENVTAQDKHSDYGEQLRLYVTESEKRGHFAPKH